MDVLFQNKLPGVYFNYKELDEERELPRMDIAAFVGFAKCGPINTPVLIEDYRYFSDIFGEDIQIAWDMEKQEYGFSNLAAAVRDFFRNDGDRCWVVRVAKKVEKQQFQVPFLINPKGTNYYSVLAEARAQGTWADDLTVNTVLEQSYLTSAILDKNEKKIVIAKKLERDILILAYFPDHNIKLYLASNNDDINFDKSEIPFRSGIAFQDITYFPDIDGYKAKIISPEGKQAEVIAPVEFEDITTSPSYTIEKFRLSYKCTDENFHLKEGQILLLQSGTSSTSSTNKRKYLFPVHNIEFGPGTYNNSSPGYTNILISANEILSPIKSTEALNILSNNEKAVIYKLEFTMMVNKSNMQISKLTELGFHSTSKRFWGRLSADEHLFKRIYSADNYKDLDQRSFDQIVVSPRFPLAYPTTGTINTYVSIPVGMPAIVNENACQPAYKSATGSTALEREGLQKDNNENFNVFFRNLFIDRDLQDKLTANITGEVINNCYVLGKELKGIHAIFPIDEVSIIAIPDAVLRPWYISSIQFPILSSTPEILSYNIRKKMLSVSWSHIDQADYYEFQYSTSADFSHPETEVTGEDGVSDIEINLICENVIWIRVRACLEYQKGPWSKSGQIFIDTDKFNSCKRIDMVALTLHLEYPKANEIMLSWNVNDNQDEEITYEIQRADGISGASFDNAVTVLKSKEVIYRQYIQKGQILWFRIRILYDKQAGPWSNTVITGMLDSQNNIFISEIEYNDTTLLEIHRALLRLCGARGDLFAVLSLPGHFREDDAMAYKEKLTSINIKDNNSSFMVPLLSYDELIILSYGALYHPWITTPYYSDINIIQNFRTTPPDGAICGSLAFFAEEQGAWIAPANEAFDSIIDLSPNDLENKKELFLDHINLLSKKPEGYVALSAYTLSNDREWEYINVRRLIILIRRIALKEGESYVFDNNDETLQRAVKRDFDDILNNLYQQGAFAGEFPDECYRVITDETVNPPQNLDSGKFVAELRVAPSHPMMFILVRLLYTLSGITVEEAYTI